VVVTPSIELGSRIELGHRGVLRPYARFGVAFHSNREWEVEGRLEAAPSNADSAIFRFNGANAVAEAQIGLDLVQANGFDLRAEYSIHVDNDDFVSQSAQLKLAYRF